MNKHFILMISLFLFSLSILAQQPIAYGPTTKNDQLWQIATSLRPNNLVSTEQMMIAILKANPEAFTSNNVYKLKIGYVLAIPTLDLVKKISAESAIKQVNEQRVDFIGIKKKPLVEPKKESNKNNQQYDNVLALIEELKEKIFVTSESYQERLVSVEQQMQSLSIKLENLSGQLSVLEQKITANHENKKEWYNIIAPLRIYSKWLYEILGTISLKLIVILIFILIVWWSLLHYRQSKLKCDQLGFMSGEEGIKAKLDLAHAYIDMDDRESARRVLAEVVNSGNRKQKAEAQELMKRC